MDGIHPASPMMPKEYGRHQEYDQQHHQAGNQRPHTTTIEVTSGHGVCLPAVGVPVSLGVALLYQGRSLNRRLKAIRLSSCPGLRPQWSWHDLRAARLSIHHPRPALGVLIQNMRNRRI